MPRLLQVLSEIMNEIPDTLTDTNAVYVRGRNVRPDMIARVASARRARYDEMRAAGWRMAENVTIVQEHALAGATPESEIARLRKDGLREDREGIEILRTVLTAAEASFLWGIDPRIVRDACEKGQILARKSQGTWLILREEALRRWGDEILHCPECLSAFVRCLPEEVDGCPSQRYRCLTCKHEFEVEDE